MNSGLPLKLICLLFIIGDLLFYVVDFTTLNIFNERGFTKYMKNDVIFFVLTWKPILFDSRIIIQ